MYLHYVLCRIIKIFKQLEEKLDKGVAIQRFVGFNCK